MTREEAKRMLPVIEAFANGELIQSRIDAEFPWGLDNNPDFDVHCEYRVLCGYRPFKNKEECWKEMQKHEPFGWIENKLGTKIFIYSLSEDYYRGIYLDDKGGMEYSTSLLFDFVDGTPFGVPCEEEIIK